MLNVVKASIGLGLTLKDGSWGATKKKWGGGKARLEKKLHICKINLTCLVHVGLEAS